MARGFRFNPSLRMPIIDIVVALLLVVASGYFWFQNQGRARLAAGRESWREAQLNNHEEIRRGLADLEQARRELAQAKADRDAKAEEARWLEEQCHVEQQRIAEGQQLDQEFTDRLLDLRMHITRLREQRGALNSDVFQAEARIREHRSRNADLEAQALERVREVERIGQWIAEAQAELRENPVSRFPERSSLSSVVEFAGIGDDPEERFVFSLARGFTRIGALDVVFLGSLGLSGGGDSSLKEGGVFANLPLAHRRASLDFEGGVSQLQSRLYDDKKTGPFAGATLRLAPLRRERLFLLAGTRYSQEDLGLRLGLGLGRR